MPCYVLKAGDTPYVKIGWADEDVEARRQTLQSAHWEDLILLRIIEGQSWIEPSMHRRFDAHHVRREWFRFHPDMLTVRVEELELPAHMPGGPVADIIELLGDTTAVSVSLGLPVMTVGNWKGRNSIPARYHAAVIKIGAGKITAEQLIMAHARQAAA